MTSRLSYKKHLGGNRDDDEKTVGVLLSLVLVAGFLSAAVPRAMAVDPAP